MLVGMDDTDSPEGMCTTYLGALLARNLERAGYRVRELQLIRLNPNVVWKTRGNAAVCLEVEGDDMESVFRLACELVEENAMFACDKTNPGVVVVRSRPDTAFYYQALRRFCTIEETVARLDTLGALYRGYKCGRGLIGALAAVSSDLPDYTWELLAYRSRDRWGTPRKFAAGSFFAAEAATFPHTWDTVDPSAGAVVCVPHGKDPVLYGIRGESPEWVSRAAADLSSETAAFSQIWKTNQGTDAHLLPYAGTPVEGLSYILDGTVVSPPRTGRGGHVSFLLQPDAGGRQLTVFAYEPTKQFRAVVRELMKGDHLTVCASYQHEALNLEKLRVTATAPTTAKHPPKCPLCGGRMTSAGTGKGYKCRSCPGRVREVPEVPRSLSPGWYEVPPGARRHLAKPLARMPDRNLPNHRTSD